MDINDVRFFLVALPTLTFMLGIFWAIFIDTLNDNQTGNDVLKFAMFVTIFSVVIILAWVGFGMNVVPR